MDGTDDIAWSKRTDNMRQLSLFQRTQKNNANLDPAVIAEIQGILHGTHAYIPLYKQACQIMSEKPEDEHSSVLL